MQFYVVLFASWLAVSKCSHLQTYSLPDKRPPSGTQYNDKVNYQQITPEKCPDGQVLHVDGRCVTPVITRSVYVFNVPQQPRRPTPLPFIPLPKIDHNILFVRLPEQLRAPDPIVVPPPQQKNIVYVLQKKTQDEGPKVIEVPAPPKTKPDVYFVGYDNGENPILPTGENLEGLLSQDAQEVYGQVVDTGVSDYIVGDGLHDHVGTNSFGHVDSDSFLPVAGFGSLDQEGSGVEDVLYGTETTDNGKNDDEGNTLVSIPFNQETSAPPFNYYIPPYKFANF